MAKVVGEVAIDVTADVGPLIRQMARGEGAMDGLRAASAKAARGLDKFGDNAVRLGKGLSIATAGIAAAAGAAFALTKSVADSGDATAKFARGAGVSTDYFQEMAFAIGQVAAVSKDELAAGMTRVTKLLGEAQMGSKSAITAFEQIGISQSELASGTVTSEAAFSKMLQTLSDTKDPAIAAAVATDLLGRSGADLGGKLAGSSGEIAKMRDRAHELGIVMSTEALNASEKFGDKLDEMQNGFQGLRVAIANELMPVFVNVLIPAMIEKVIPALQDVVKQIGTVIEWFAGLPGPVLEAAALIGTALGLGGPILIGIGLVSSALSLLIASTGPIGLFIAAASLIVAAWMTWGDDIKSIISTVADFITTAFADGLAAVVGFGQSARDAVGGAVTFMSDQFNVFLEYVRTIPAQLLEIGSQMIQGLLDGIMLKWEELKAKIYELGALLPQWMREKLETHSPSRVFHEIGGDIGQGLANGIAESSAMVNAAVSVLTDGAVASTQGMATQIMSTLGTLFQGSKKFAIAQALVNAWTGATEALKLPFPENIAAFAKVLGTGLNAVKNIKSAKPGGGGGGGSSAGSVAAPAAPQSVANISLVGDTFSRNSIEGLFTQINDGLRQGRVINLVRA